MQLIDRASVFSFGKAIRCLAVQTITLGKDVVCVAADAADNEAAAAAVRDVSASAAAVTACSA